MVGPDGKRRKTHVFRIVLSHSRKGHSEAVFRQTTENVLRCLKNALHYFGGIREARDVLWLGPPGVGKSFLVQALGYQAIKSGYLVYYRSVFDVVRDFMQDEAFGGQDRVLAKYLKPILLAIDDMGMKQLPPKSGEFLFEIIMRRYEPKNTMMTSNRPLEDWGKLIGDVPAASAILDRFLHRAELIQITGKSYRLRDRDDTPPPPPENKKRHRPADQEPGDAA